MAKSISVLLVTSEIYPFVKTSEIADLCYAHSLGSREVGTDFRAMMPKYGYISERKNRIHEINRLRDIPIPVGVEEFPATVKSSSINNPRVKVQAYITTNTNFLDARKGILADNTTGSLFPDNDERYIFYNRTVLETCLLLGWFPDVIHCIGWQTALVPAYMRTMFTDAFKKTKIVMTIDDFAEQGVFSPKTLAKTNLPEPVRDIMKYKNKANFLRAGIAHADAVTTLSPGYAEELLALKEFKDNWLPLFKRKSLDGIAHGIDQLQWNPKNDAVLKSKYDAKDRSGKALCREHLQKAVGLPVDASAIVASFVNQLSESEGADALLAAVPEMVKEGVQVILRSDVPTDFTKDALALQKKFPTVKVLIGSDEEMLHKIMAGSTVLLKPARSCSHAQYVRVALAYGTIPVVRQTGGLSEGLTQADAQGTGNAFIMKKADAADIVSTLKSVKALQSIHATWDQLVTNAMTSNVSWTLSSKPYDELYRNLLKETK
ncbi:MAG TPA: glycogen/starch synthase [Chlorobiota bacterium]|nr:glycogen/starch synthase [Chlorobiota bacterium]